MQFPATNAQTDFKYAWKICCIFLFYIYLFPRPFFYTDIYNLHFNLVNINYGNSINLNTQLKITCI